MGEERLGFSARVVWAVRRWVDGWPPPRELFGRTARWVPALVFLGGTGLVLLLLFGIPFTAEAGRWLVGAATVPVWILRVATLEREALRAPRFGAASSMVRWWIAGVGVVAVVWVPLGELGTGLTGAAALLFLFLAHGRYALAVRS